jgi:hypothetical protein
MSMQEFVDSYTMGGALRLVQRIKAYWQLQGYPKIDAWVERTTVLDPSQVRVSHWKIKTNLNKRGFPPK